MLHRSAKADAVEPLVDTSSLSQPPKFSFRSKTIRPEEHDASIDLSYSARCACDFWRHRTVLGRVRHMDRGDAPKADSGDVAHVALVFVLNQADGQVTGEAGPERSGEPFNEAKLAGDRLTFSVTPSAGEKGPTWKFDLKLSGTCMEGRAEGTNGGRILGSTEVVMNRRK